MPSSVASREVVRFRAARERSRRLFEELLREDAYFERPIPLRQPIVFYEGHLPAFAVNTLVKWALGRGGVDAGLEALFERGIDPADEAHVTGPAAWPSRPQVQDFARRADALVEPALDASGERVALAVGTVLEHELMHHETLLYMLHQLAPEKLRRAPAAGPRPGRPAAPAVHVPAGRATLGAERHELEFGWDNEFPRLLVEVPAFEIDAQPVTNAGFLEFVEAGGYARRELWDAEGWAFRSERGLEAPPFWRRRAGRFLLRGLFEERPLPLDRPVFVSHAEAAAYCRFRGRRLPSEAEFQRAAYATPQGGERAQPWGDAAPLPGVHGNFGFVDFDPWPVGSCPEGDSAFGVQELVGNGWEWTSSVFAGFPGFEPMASYPVYSRDFFDGAHFVLKGASPVTAVELVRRSFRNWFRPRYPYVYAKFRGVAAS
jgi:ergothioneine biosynthesis protein EgtB